MLPVFSVTAERRRIWATLQVAENVLPTLPMGKSFTKHTFTPMQITHPNEAVYLIKESCLFTLSLYLVLFQASRQHDNISSHIVSPVDGK